MILHNPRSLLLVRQNVEQAFHLGVPLAAQLSVGSGVRV